MQDPLLDDLNEAQRAAVTHGTGPLLVLAGAGTGKTRVLTRRIAWLIATRTAAPSEILGLTFTDKAAQEMEERVDRLVPFGYTDMTLSTFHALGHRLLSESGMLLGLPREPRVLTGAETVVFLRERLFVLPLERLRPLGDPTRHLDGLVRHFGRLADEDIGPDAYAAYAEAERSAAHETNDAARLDRAEIFAELAACYRAYLELLAAEGVVDFAGLLTLSLRLLREQPALRAELRRRHRWILVDEFQDTNFVQFEIVRLLAGDSPNLTVVGDDDQSIYKFRGASISNILDFRKAYPACTTRVLVENYRSTQPILDAAYRLIRHNDPERLEFKEKVDKRLRASGPRPEGPDVFAQGFDSPSTEADHVARTIRGAVDAGTRRYGDFAVLVRRHAATDPVVRALALLDVPCRIADGGGLYDRPEVVAALDALAAMSDPTDDRAVFFLAASEVYGVPALAIAELRRAAEKRHRGLLPFIRDSLGGLDDAARAPLARLLDDLAEMRPFALRHPTGETLYKYLALSGWLERLTSAGAEGDVEADLKVQNLAKLFNVTRSFSDLALRDRPIEFVRHLELLRQAGDDPRAAEPEEDADAVQVLTVHKAKGLEFPVVFLVGLEANHFPGANRGDPLPFPEALMRQAHPSGDVHRAEERRLFYVGMTRAREELHLSWALDHGAARKWKPSPFVLEALDQARLDAPLAPAAHEEQLHRHMRAPEPVPLPLAPLGPDDELELSNRQVDDWLTCPLRYKYAHVLRVPLLPHHTVGYGLALHNAIREYYVHAREGWPIDGDRLVRVFEESWTGEGFITREHELQRLEQGRAAIRGWYERERAHPSSPAVVEGSFRFKRGANLVRGRFDRVDVRPVGAVIVDFKSSAVDAQAKADKRAKESLQLAIYALAWRETTEAAKRPAAGELHFIESGLVGRVEFDDATLTKAGAAIDQAAAGIRARSFAATPDWNLCRYCAYHAICPSRAKVAAT